MVKLPFTVIGAASVTVTATVAVTSATPSAEAVTTNAADPVRASRAVLRRVLSERAAVLTANAQEELSSSDSIMGGQIMSMIAVPLWRGDDISGLIQADNRSTAGMFTERDLQVAMLLGSQAALAIDNATLVGRLKIAEELQDAFPQPRGGVFGYGV